MIQRTPREYGSIPTRICWNLPKQTSNGVYVNGGLERLCPVDESTSDEAYAARESITWSRNGTGSGFWEEFHGYWAPYYGEWYSPYQCYAYLHQETYSYVATVRALWCTNATLDYMGWATNSCTGSLASWEPSFPSGFRKVDWTWDYWENYDEQYGPTLHRNGAERTDYTIETTPGEGLPGKTNKFFKVQVSVNEAAVGTNQVTAGNLLSYTNIYVAGQPLNADYCVFVRTFNNCAIDLTPTLSNTTVTNYLFNVATQSFRTITMTRSYHPLFGTNPPSLSALQEAFDQGSLGLGKDDDERIADTDLRVTNFTGNTNYNVTNYLADGVPVYVEFLIQDAGAFPSGPHATNNGVPFDFNESKYFEIENLLDETNLVLYAGFSVIKQMNTMLMGGRARTDAASIIVPNSSNQLTLIHEWGHTMGLQHRGNSSNPASDGLGETNTTDHAVMYWGWPSYPIINREERSAMNAQGPY